MQETSCNASETFCLRVAFESGNFSLKLKKNYFFKTTFSNFLHLLRLQPPLRHRKTSKLQIQVKPLWMKFISELKKKLKLIHPKSGYMKLGKPSLVKCNNIVIVIIIAWYLDNAFSYLHDLFKYISHWRKMAVILLGCNPRI